MNRNGFMNNPDYGPFGFAQGKLGEESRRK
jgi:hypothetical protein